MCVNRVYGVKNLSEIDIKSIGAQSGDVKDVKRSLRLCERRMHSYPRL